MNNNWKFAHIFMVLLMLAAGVHQFHHAAHDHEAEEAEAHIAETCVLATLADAVHCVAPAVLIATPIIAPSHPKTSQTHRSLQAYSRYARGPPHLLVI